jgi:hypothetical protein
MIETTAASKALFIAFAEDAGNWGGMPLVGGNVSITKEERGNLTHLKKLGLVITTEVIESVGPLIWLEFTEAGERYANELGIHLGADHVYKINAAHFGRVEAIGE